MGLVELGGSVQGELRPYGRQHIAQGGRAQHVVGALQGLVVVGVPPHHQVGIGAQTGHVVPPADHQIGVGGHGLQLLQRLFAGTRAGSRLGAEQRTTSCSAACG